VDRVVISEVGVPVDRVVEKQVEVPVERVVEVVKEVMQHRVLFATSFSLVQAATCKHPAITHNCLHACTLTQSSSPRQIRNKNKQPRWR
jgi:hypothetical protein